MFAFQEAPRRVAFFLSSVLSIGFCCCGLIAPALAKAPPSSVAHEQAQAITPLPKLLARAHQGWRALAPHVEGGCERVGVRVHLTPRQAQSTQEAREADLAWLNQHFQEANRLFSPLKVCFELSELLTHPASDAHMKTREQRSSLGARGGFKRGVVELFIVDRLDDVDVPDTQIRGVHWRHPKAKKTRRWVILSRVAQPLVLAHELGHYFSLPHGKDPYSIMNKTPRDIPYTARGFTEKERAKMRRAWREMKRSAHLVPLL